MFLALLLPVAHAGDSPLYQSTLGLLEEHYLEPALLDRHAMFRDAGQQLENRIEWLLVDAEGDTLHLRDGAGAWSADVTLDNPEELPDALGRLQDCVLSAGLPLGAGTDLRVELLRGMVHELD